MSSSPALWARMRGRRLDIPLGGRTEGATVTANMTIGDFSRATRLSAKTLRFYHQVGLLEPARVDASNGYRFYDPQQIADAQAIRHFRSLDVPVELMKEILGTDSIAERNAAMSSHLARLQTQLERTLSAVASLKGLLESAPEPLEIRHRSLPATPACVLRETIDLGDLESWYRGAMSELDAFIDATNVEPAGPRGGLWDTELFLDERGGAALYFPLHALDAVAGSGRVRTELLPAVELAVAVHCGSDETVAQTYGVLGGYVSQYELGVAGPIREKYLRAPNADGGDAITEIGWPIFRTAR